MAGDNKKKDLERFINACLAEEGKSPVEIDDVEDSNPEEDTKVMTVSLKGGGKFKITLKKWPR